MALSSSASRRRIISKDTVSNLQTATLRRTMSATSGRWGLGGSPEGRASLPAPLTQLQGLDRYRDSGYSDGDGDSEACVHRVLLSLRDAPPGLGGRRGICLKPLSTDGASTASLVGPGFSGVGVRIQRC